MTRFIKECLGASMYTVWMIACNLVLVDDFGFRVHQRIGEMSGAGLGNKERRWTFREAPHETSRGTFAMTFWKPLIQCRERKLQSSKPLNC
jgi:hypothetical protein